jgi:hypothetical protein
MSEKGWWAEFKDEWKSQSAPGGIHYFDHGLNQWMYEPPPGRKFGRGVTTPLAPKEKSVNMSPVQDRNLKLQYERKHGRRR